MKSFDVCVVGAGPVGLTLTHLLEKLGVSTILLDQSKNIATLPKAHLINRRTKEVSLF